MYKRGWSVLIFLAVVAISSPTRAQVQITLGPTSGMPADNIVKFTQNTALTRLDLSLGCPSASVTCTLTSSPNSTAFLTVNGSTSGGFGPYTFITTLTGVGVLPYLDSPVSGTFAFHSNGATTAFSVSGIGATPGSVGMNIFIQNVTDGSLTPRFNGTYTVTSVAPNTTPALYFHSGDTNVFDFNVGTSRTLLDLFGGKNGDSTSGGITSGAMHTPEPASIALFGSGLLLLGGVLRRRKNYVSAEPWGG